MNGKADHLAVPLGLALGAATIVLFVAALGQGRAPIGLGAWLDGDPTARLIVWEVRLPRAMLAVLVGASLGLAGAALQGLLLNPLAEPALIGVTASAALGAVIVFYFGFAAVVPLALPLGGMAGAMIAVLLIFALAGRDAGSLGLILAGVAVNSLAAALTALALNLAPSPYAVAEIMSWLLGSFADRSLADIALVAPFILLGWLVLAGTARGLAALSLGESTAQSLGIVISRLRWQVVIGTALCVGAGTAVAGSIGFIGLVVPHVLRPLVGYRPGPLLAVSALGGAVLALAADLAVRMIDATPELNLGVLTALIGAPFFLWLVIKTRRAMT